VLYPNLAGLRCHFFVGCQIFLWYWQYIPVNVSLHAIATLNPILLYFEPCTMLEAIRIRFIVCGKCFFFENKR
jgi:hypothetical protein